MILIQILFLIIYIGLISCIKDSTKKLIAISIISLYSIQLILGLLDIYNVHELSSNVVVLFNICIIGLVSGFLSFKRRSIEIHSIDILFANIKIVIFISLLFTLCSFIVYIKYNAILTISPEISARELIFRQGLLFERYYEQFIFTYLIGPTKYISASLFSILLLKRNKSKLEFLLMLVSLINAGCLMSIGQGRFGFLLLIVYPYVISVFYRKIDRAYFKKLSLSMFFLLIVVFVLMLATTAMRYKIDNISDIFSISNIFLEHLYMYFTFPISACDFAIQNNFFDNYFFGFASFAGIIDIIMLPLNMIFKDYITPNSYIGSILSPAYNIYGYSWNALYSGVYINYLDLSFIGVFIFPFGYAFVLSRLLYNAQRNFNLRNIMLLQYCMYSMVMNLFSSATQSLEFWFVIILIYLLTPKYKYNFTLKL